MFTKARFLLAILAFFSAFSLMMVAYSPAYAENGAKSDTKTSPEYEKIARYHFYSGGFHFVTADLSVTKKNGSYEGLFVAFPHGWLSRMLPWSAEIKVQGKIKEDSLVPQEFVNMTAWREVPSTASLVYDKEGRLVRFTKENQKSGLREEKIKEEHAVNTVDVLTAVIQTVSNNLEETCNQTYPVFDGKRRFNITLKDPKPVMLESSRYNIFEGEAVECVLDIEPIEGFKDKRRGWASLDADDKQRNQQPTVWFGKDTETNTVRLVKIQLRTDYGMVLAHLAK